MISPPANPVEFQKFLSVRGRLWSLLEMFQKNGLDFAVFVNAIQALQTIFQSNHRRDFQEYFNTDDEFEHMQKVLSIISKTGTALGLEFTALHAERMSKRMDEHFEAMTWARYNDSAKDLLDTMRKEIKPYHALFLEKDEVKFWKGDKLFGQKVWRNFKSAREDIALSGKCLAVGCWNASVFHQLRAAERGLNSVAIWTKATVLPTDPWGTIINKIEPNAESLPKKEKEYAKAIVGILHLLKQTRNTRVMHIDDDPCDEQTARSHYKYVENFMQLTAKHLNQDGVYTP